MKKHLKKFSFLILLTFCVIPGNSFAQDIEVSFHDTELTDTIGADIKFGIDVINLTDMDQTVFLVRTINSLPPEWTAPLCIGDGCFPPHLDSIATNSDFGLVPVGPHDTLFASLHIFAIDVEGNSDVEVEIGTFRNPDIRTSQNFIAHVFPVSVEDDENQPNNFFLAQNYPNPFNPSTQIKYGLNEPGFVSLKIYDVLGNEVADLISDFRLAGSYEVKFSSAHLSSGIYIYRLVSGHFSETRKMILEK